LQEDVAQFFSQFCVVLMIDGLQDFIRFFEEIGLQRLVRLLAVSGAPVRGAQGCHEVD